MEENNIDKIFTFESVGKEMPYRIDKREDDFLSNLTFSTLAKAKRRRLIRLRKMVGSFAASLIALSFILYIATNNSNSELTIDELIGDMSYKGLQDIADISTIDPLQYVDYDNNIY